MGGPFRAIVGGQPSYKLSFAPADWVRVDNNSDQYFLLVDLDDYVAPGQINKFVYIGGISSLTVKFAAPPGRSQAAPTNGQIAQVWTYEVGATGGPFSASPGLLLPIGLDQPLHLHHHANTHVHGHSAAHAHTTGGELAAHTHSIFIQNDNTAVPLGLGAGNVLALITGSGFAARVAMTDANGDSGHSHGNTGASAPGNTDAASPGDSDLENIQHTHP